MSDTSSTPSNPTPQPLNPSPDFLKLTKLMHESLGRRLLTIYESLIACTDIAHQVLQLSADEKELLLSFCSGPAAPATAIATTGAQAPVASAMTQGAATSIPAQDGATVTVAQGPAAMVAQGPAATAAPTNSGSSVVGVSHLQPGNTYYKTDVPADVYFVVTRGRVPGIYANTGDATLQTLGISHAFMLGGFTSMATAESYMDGTIMRAGGSFHVV